MSTGTKNVWTWCTVCLGTGILVHILALYSMPWMIMQYALHKIRAGVPNTPVVNDMIHYGVRTPADRDVVRPSPDLLYSICMYDLSNGDLLISGNTPKQTYQSIALYGSNTDNYFVLSNQDIAGDNYSVRVTIRERAGATDGATAPHNAVSPTKTGIVLVRTLLANEADYESIAAVQKTGACRIASADGL